MKKLITIFAAVLISATLWAQSPQKMSYQAVIRNSSNQLVANSVVGMRISIMKNAPNTGILVYQEVQTPTTNANGLVSLEIGGNYSGFDTIHWANGPYFIKTETDPDGGTNYTIVGSSELLSVPYSLHAKTAESITGSISETDPVFGASPAAGITGTNITNWNNNMLPAGTNYQTLYHNGTSWIPAGNMTNDGYDVWINSLHTHFPIEADQGMISSGPIYINNTPGMPPMYVSSSTKVDYLNVDLLDDKHASDFVSLGMAGNINYIPKWTSSSGLGNSLIYDAGSNVGIGTTSPTSTFEVQNSYGVVARFVGESAMASSDTYVGIRDLTGGVDWYLCADQGGNFSINQGGGANRISINHTTGNISMGMGSTADKLAVNGVISATGGNSTQWNSAYGWGDHASAGYLTSYTETDPIFIASPAASITGGNITNWNNNMLPAGSSGQTLRHDGNFWASTSNLYNDGTRIGIGMVPNNDVLLDIHGGTGQPFAMSHYTSAITGSYTTDGFMVGLSGNDGVAYVWNHETQPIIFGTSSTDRMIIDASGNIGIGTSLPLAQLHTTGTVRFEGAGVPGPGKVLTSDLTGNATWQSSSGMPGGSSGQTLRYSGSTWVASSTIYNDGSNVGIGTSSPLQKLGVSGGSIRTTGQLISTLATGTPPMTVSSTTAVTNLNADMLDGNHAGNATGNIPVSNGTVNTNLNADMVDGIHAGSLEKTVASGLVPAGSSIDITIPNYLPFTLQLSSGWPARLTTNSGGQALIQGAANDQAVGMLISCSNGAEHAGGLGTATVTSTYKSANMIGSVNIITFGGTGGNLYTISTTGTNLVLRLTTAPGSIELMYKLVY